MLIEEAIRLDPARSLSEYEALRGTLYEVVGNDRPRRPQEMYDRGVGMGSKDQYAASIAAYREAINLDPAFAWPYNNLAWLLATARDSLLPRRRQGCRIRLEGVPAIRPVFLGVPGYARGGVRPCRRFHESDRSHRGFAPVGSQSSHALRSIDVAWFQAGERPTSTTTPPRLGRGSFEMRAQGVSRGEWQRTQQAHGRPGFLSDPMGHELRPEVRALYPPAMEDIDGDLILEEEFGGENSEILLIFAAHVLWRVVVNQATASMATLLSPASPVCVSFSTTPTESPSMSRTDWHDQSSHRQDDPSIWGLAVAAGHLKLFASWKTEETAVFLTCVRREDSQVYTSVEFRSIHYWQAEPSETADLNDASRRSPDRAADGLPETIGPCSCGKYILRVSSAHGFQCCLHPRRRHYCDSFL